MFFFRKVRRFGLCSSTRVCDVSVYLSLADSKQFKSIQSPSHCCLTYFHLRRTSVVCVLEDMVTSFPYVSIVSVKNSFIPPMLISFLQLFTLVCDSFIGAYSFIFLFLNSCVVICCFLSNKENKEISDGRARVTRDL